jgi:hypothetical protein
MADKLDKMVIAPPKHPASPFATAGTQQGEMATPWTLPVGLVEGNELIILAIKPSMWRPLLESAAWLIAGVGFAITLTVLGTPLPGLSLTTSAQLVLLVGLGRLGFAILRWVPSWYVLTNRRIIEIQGVRHPRIAATPLLEVRNTYVNFSTIEKATGTGTLSYTNVDAEQPARHWQTIPSPIEIHAQIRRAIENAIDSTGT